jgi:kynureninase
VTAADPLAAFRDRFVVDDPDLCYLAGNSLGRLPRATVERLRRVVADEWGGGLVRSWEEWIDLPTRVGDAIGALLGAAPGSVVVADSTTVNLHAVLTAACTVRDGDLVVPEDDFPTDRYVVAGVASAFGRRVRKTTRHEGIGIIVTSAVDFRSGELLRLDLLAEMARSLGAWVCLDLSHAAGVVPIDLAALGVELAVGCTYKHLHGGPGAPAFLYVRPDLQPRLRRPQWGWFAQRDQFAMGPAFDPVDGIGRFLAGTPAVLGLAAVEEGVRLVAEAGIDAIRAKSQALTTNARALVAERLEPLGMGWASPSDLTRIGGHVCLSHPAAVAVGVAARAAGVVPDVRPPDRIRLGLSPLSTSFEELAEGIDRLATIAAAGVDPGTARPRVT